jgi:hypothetical protein
MGRAGIKEDTIDEENDEEAGAVIYCLFLFALLFCCRLNVVEVGVIIPDWRCFKPELLPAWTWTLPTLQIMQIMQIMQISFMEREEVLISRSEGLSSRLSS